jgi:hypothetical protein
LAEKKISLKMLCVENKALPEVRIDLTNPSGERQNQSTVTGQEGLPLIDREMLDRWEYSLFRDLSDSRRLRELLQSSHIVGMSQQRDSIQTVSRADEADGHTPEDHPIPEAPSPLELRPKPSSVETAARS